MGRKFVAKSQMLQFTHSQPVAGGTVSVQLRRTISPTVYIDQNFVRPLKIASVALPLPIQSPFSYLVPDDLQEIVRCGSAVLVPFGRQMFTGIVMGEADPPPAIPKQPSPAEKKSFTLKSIADVLDLEPVVTDDQLRLAAWIADYYLCAPGEVLRAMLPPGIGSSSELTVSVLQTDRTSSELSDVERQILKAISESGSVVARTLRKTCPIATGARLRRLEAKGYLKIQLVIRGPRTSVRTITMVRAAEHPPDFLPKGPKQQAVINLLRDRKKDDKTADGILQPDLLTRTGASSATIRRLEELGYVLRSEHVLDRSRLQAVPESDIPPAPDHVLEPAQNDAIEKISSALEENRFETYLLHGVTGSGKTEVYIEALKKARDNGKSAIILVPEIALTPQTVARFTAHFGNNIAVLHSRMSPGERFDAWRGIRAGKYPIVIGPRSAVLAPVPDLGLIVVDEEHEQSYKQFDPAPRYHARDVAVIRSMHASAVCVLGSATPSLESLANARNSKYTLLSMPERVVVDGRRATLPDVRVVDMRSVEKVDGERPVISSALETAIQVRLTNGEQVILLQNRRGYAPTVRCSSCNWAPDCPDCSVSMTYHKSRRHLRCHYCGRTNKLPAGCPSCGNDDLMQLGVGTQRVEEELLRLFPDVRVARMDLDTTTEKNAHHRILERFGSGKADVLLGTQMVSKGLDFGNVSLVGIISADTGLQLPDIRSEERTFQLLTQVAGRAGRAELPGEVILQTYNPGHRVIQFAMKHDFLRFADTVLPERSALQYPPYGKILAVLFSGPSESMVNRLATQWCAAARNLDNHLEILGPSPSFIGRVRKNYRAQVLIKVDPVRSHLAVRKLIRQTNKTLGSPPKNYRIAVDVDPVGLA